MEIYLRLLEQAYFEIGEAFKDLNDANVWKRPAEGVLSIGEIAGHMTYWESIRLAGEGEDVTKCKVTSPLIDARFRYLSDTLKSSPSEQHLAMTAAQVHDEMQRVHKEVLVHFQALNPNLDGPVPGLAAFWTYRSSLEYLIFHVAYHTGQIYLTRHLLGETTPDN